MNTNYQNALTFISGYGWNDENLRKADGIITLVATMLELYKNESDTEVTRLQNIGIAMANDIEDKRNKIMLLKKALVRMVAEFDTATPVVPNQKKALEYANELLLKMMND